MAKPPKSATSPHSKPKPEKRKPGHSQDENSTRSPIPKRAKLSNNDKATSTSQPTPPNPRPPITSSRDAVPAPVPAANDAWKQEFRVERLSIITSSRIVQRVTRTVDAVMDEAGAKPAVVELHTRGPATGKMITVVEIAKREVEKRGGEWFQYSRVEQVVAERKVEGGGGGNDNKGEGKGKGKADEEMGAEEGAGENGEEMESFETMKTPFERANEGRAKVRAVPVMTIYLSRKRIEALRKVYGEQTNATEAPKG